MFVRKEVTTIYDKISKSLYKAFMSLFYVTIAIMTLFLTIVCPVAFVMKHFCLSLVKAVIVYFVIIAAIALICLIRHVLQHGEDLLEKERNDIS